MVNLIYCPHRLRCQLEERGIIIRADIVACIVDDPRRVLDGVKVTANVYKHF